MSIDYSVIKKIELPDHTEKSRVHDAVLGTCENGDSLMYVKSRANGRVLSLVRNTADYKKNIALNVPMNPNVGQKAYGLRARVSALRQHFLIQDL